MADYATVREQLDKPAGDNLVAVIDVGASSLRMEIAQIGPGSNIRTLEFLRQAVSLGKETFAKGVIGLEATEECVKALKSFRRILDEYQLTDQRRIRAVATSAVREAMNRNAFLDRVYIATGIEVEVLDEDKCNQYTYLSVRRVLEKYPGFKDHENLVIEVGAGSTEVIVTSGMDVIFSHTYRIGSLRIRGMLENFRAPTSRLPQMFDTHVRRAVNEIRQNNKLLNKVENMLIIGSDARFAAAQLLPDWDRLTPVVLPVTSLIRFSATLFDLSVDDVARRFHISYPDAETLCPALLMYGRLAQSLNLSQIVIADVSLRDGLLVEMASQISWTEDFSRQIINSALEVGRKYHFHRDRAEQTAAMCDMLFELMKSELQLPARYRVLLNVAALLCKIGNFISDRGSHKHALYLINNSEIFGLDAADKELVALLARYHRKASPSAWHQEYVRLDRDQRLILVKLASLLRIADAVQHAHVYEARHIRMCLEDGSLVINVGRAPDLSLEMLALQQGSNLFEQVYGRTVELRAGH